MMRRSRHSFAKEEGVDGKSAIGYLQYIAPH